MGLARNQASSLESIHCRGDRPAGERDAPSDLIDRLWSLVKKQLHDPEVGEAHLKRLDALSRQALERPVRLHQHEPHMRARDVGGLPPCRGASHPRQYLNVKILHVKHRSELHHTSQQGRHHREASVRPFCARTKRMTKSASHTSDATPIGSSQASGSVRVRATCRVAVGRSTGAHERDWVALLVIPAGITSALDKSRLTNARGRETGMTATGTRTVRDVAEERPVRVAIPPETAPNATLLLRLMAGSVFLWEGILKFVFVNQGV